MESDPRLAGKIFWPTFLPFASDQIPLLNANGQFDKVVLRANLPGRIRLTNWLAGELAEKKKKSVGLTGRRSQSLT